MGIFVNDSFTGTDATSILSHAGEVGATWTRHPAWTTGDAKLLANRLGGTSGSLTFVPSGTPAGAEYNITADFYINTADTGRDKFVAGRVRTAGNLKEKYLAGYSISNARWELQKRDSTDASTLLGSWSETLIAGDTRTLRFEVKDASKKVFIGGVERISSTDNAFSGALYAYVGYHQTSGYSNWGPELDYFTAEDIAPPGPQIVYPTGFFEGVLGSPQLNLAIYPSGFSQEPFGIPVVSNLLQILYPNGLPPEAFGTPGIQLMLQMLYPVGVGPEPFGLPTVIRLGEPQTLYPVGIPEGTIFGNPSVTNWAQVVYAVGIAPSDTFGTPSVSLSLTPKQVYWYDATGKTFDALVVQSSTGDILDSDGVLKSNPTSPFLTMTENTLDKGRYGLTISSILPDGQFVISIRERSGGAPSYNDPVMGEALMIIKSNEEVFTDDWVSSRLPTAGYVAPYPPVSVVDMLAGGVAKEATLTTMQTDITFLMDCIKNKKYLSKVGATWYLIIRNTGDTADIINKALKDKSGNDITDIAAGALNFEMKTSV